MGFKRSRVQIAAPRPEKRARNWPGCSTHPGLWLWFDNHLDNHQAGKVGWACRQAAGVARSQWKDDRVGWLLLALARPEFAPASPQACSFWSDAQLRSFQCQYEQSSG